MDSETAPLTRRLSIVEDHKDDSCEQIIGEGNDAALPLVDHESSRQSFRRLTRRRSSRLSLRGKTTHLFADWFQRPQIVKARAILQGKICASTMIVALSLALFLPDIWVVLGIGTNVELDVMLFMVMALFTLEMLSLMLLEQTYFLSFFHLMDLLGTLSMAFDISFLLGSDARVPHMASTVGHNKNLMILRTVRAARVGARAGRLSRVLRIFRFLAFMQDKGAKSIGGVISIQLSNLLASRVACLTIVLVMVIPLFDILSFPQVDYSLQAWTDRVAVNMNSGDMDRVVKELEQMVAFFSRHNYGPYSSCTGHVEGESFVCEKFITGWTPILGPPERGASSLIVRADNVTVAFNMEGPRAVDAGLAMLNIGFTVIIMVVSGLALSSVVRDLAVRPLERMLLTVRQIASTVFKFAENDDSEGELSEHEYEEMLAQEVADIDNSSEMILLERVVHKLAIVADLQSREEVVHTDDMQEEDIAVLSMMQGRTVGNTGAVRPVQKAQNANRRRGQVTVAGIRLEELGLSQEAYQSWAFNTLDMTKQQRCTVAVYTISRFHEQGEGFVRTAEEEGTLTLFVNAIEQGYQQNAFHNFAHAVDVLHCTARILRMMHSDAFLSDLEQFALLIAAIAHDLGHPGVNNGFLSETSHELALQYNDQSPLENMHCAKMFSIVANADTNVFGNLTREQYKEVRKQCIETILHTDMMGHNTMVKDLQMIYQMNSEIFNSAGLEVDQTGSIGYAASPEEIEVCSRPETKVLIMDMVLHSADVSNPCRTWEVTRAWAHVCLEEFFAQGDMEKSLGIPIQFLNDRDKLNRPNSQIGFIEFMIAPFYTAQIRLWPRLHEFGDNLVANMHHWEEEWMQEVNPAEEERQKVRARVEKVKAALEDAKMRR